MKTLSITELEERLYDPEQSMFAAAEIFERSLESAVKFEAEKREQLLREGYPADFEPLSKLRESIALLQKILHSERSIFHSPTKAGIRELARIFLDIILATDQIGFCLSERPNPIPGDGMDSSS